MFPVKSQSLLLIGSLVWFLSVYHQGHQCHAPLMPKIDLKDKSYMLEYFVEQGANTKTDVQEMHSAWQGRSKLHLEWYQQKEGKEQGQVGTIYADKENVLGVFPKEGVAPSCSKMKHLDVDLLFNQQSITEFDSGHLIGAARLLAFVQANIDKFFQITPTSTESGGSAPVYKLVFEARFTPKSSDEFTVTLFYHEQAVQNLPNGIPRMLSIKTGASPRTTHVFKRYHALKVGQVQAGTSSIESVDQYRYSDGDEVTLDMFAIDPSLRCSKALMKSGDIYGPILPLSRFSFNTRMAMAGPKAPQEITVAYEPILQNLRIDLVFADRFVTKLLDFGDGHQYHIARKRSMAANAMLNQVFQPDQERSCVMSQIHIYNTRKNPFSMKQMLLGTNPFAYLGLARVRGIEAQVYAYDDCDRPLWLQQPIVHLDASGGPLTDYKKDFRNDTKRLNEMGYSITNVFYFAKTDLDSKDISQAKLLLFEIMTRDDATDQIVAKRSFSIFNFEWGLPSSSPGAASTRYEDLFSLQDDCLADVDDGEYATINLLLEAKVEKKDVDWLQDRTKRNLALLRLFQNQILYNPISMVYDLESRLTTGAAATIQNSHEPFYPVSLAVSLKAAQRSDKAANLVYLGMVKVNLDYVNIVEVDSFQLCHLFAAHKRADTIFAYRPDTYECFLIKPEIFSAYDGYDTLMKKMSENQIGTREEEFYQIQHEDKTKGRKSEMSVFRKAKKQLEQVASFRLIDPTVIYADPEKSDSSIVVSNKQAHVIGLDDDVGKSYDENGHPLSGTNKFLGFGLIASDHRNRLVELDEANDASEMSFDHCQTACLADLDCRSFSLCHRRGVWSCVLSDVSFSSPSMARQISELSEKKNAKSGDRFPISIDPNEQNSFTRNSETILESSNDSLIQLMKHLACELHNKLYRDLFDAHGEEPIGLAKGTISYAVAHAEQCAQICFQKTLEFLREERDQLGEIQGLEFAQKPDMSANQVCDLFYYIDQETISGLKPERAELFKASIDDAYQPSREVGGYCVLERNAKYSHDYTDKNRIGTIFCQQYSFNYLNLYTKQFGVSMDKSDMPDKVRGTKFGFEHRNPKDLDEIKPENYGTEAYISSKRMHSAQTSHCAAECFLPKFKTAFPSCQSFDSYIITNPKKPSQTVCAFNSMTLAAATAANRSDLIRIGSDKQERVRVGLMDTVRVWHYELRPGLVADSVEAMYKIQLAQDIKLTEDENSTQVHIGGFLLFCVLLITLSLGIAVGINLGSRLLVRNAMEHGDTTQLVEDRRVTEADQAKVELGYITKSNGEEGGQNSQK